MASPLQDGTTFGVWASAGVAYARIPTPTVTAMVMRDFFIVCPPCSGVRPLHRVICSL